jgi:hypothetical protein
VSSLLSLHKISSGRFIAGIGVGDHMSEAENVAFGLPFASASERLSSLRSCVSELRSKGVEVWIGCGSRKASRTLEIAAATGAVVNVWDAPTEDVAWLNDQGYVGVTWGGFAGRGSDAKAAVSVDAMADHLVRLANAGAKWAVCAAPASLEDLAEAVSRVRKELAAR